MTTILLLEDDKNLNRGISQRLEKEGYRVCQAFGMTEAKEIFQREEIQLVISDITLQDGDGITFCRWVRGRSSVMFLFLTALDQEIDIVNGYDIGADDYLTKPFSLMVLLSKVHALLRRRKKEQDGVLRSGELVFQIREMRVFLGGAELLMSKKELQLLLYFLKNPRQVLSKEQILEMVWDMDGQFVDDNTLAVNIRRLRTKLGESGTWIKNVRGIGYIWTEEVGKE
nr:response regulator transcription factor [uncultured Faecalimonas sp.]